MNKIKNILDSAMTKSLVFVAAVVSLIAYISVNDLCVYWFHQPEMPDAVKKMKK